jgi:hypothetical protein
VDLLHPTLMLAREAEALAGCIQAEAMQGNCSRAFLETYSARLLKVAARLYAGSLPATTTTIPGGHDAA